MATDTEQNPRRQTSTRELQTDRLINTRYPFGTGWFMWRLASWVLHRYVWSGRRPDLTIPSAVGRYLERWWVIPKNRFFNVYVHHMYSDDDGRALHDHPWVNVSLVLLGAYREVKLSGAPIRRSGAIVFRRAKTAHRLEVVDGPVLSVFITGPKIRDWGFRCPRGWKFHSEFERDGGC